MVPHAVVQWGSDACSWLCWLWAATSVGLQQFVAQASPPREHVSSVEQDTPGDPVSTASSLSVPSWHSLAVLKNNCENKSSTIREHGEGVEIMDEF